jgi:Leucine-rich repeat (LRR) protein
MMRPAVRLACLLAALTLLAACGGEVVTPPPDPSPPAPVEAPAPEPVTTPAPATRRVAFHPDDLTGDLTGVTELDLAFSATDRLERRASVDDERSYEQACAGLDLVGLAARAPQLRSLRLSGCQTAAHVGLGAFLNLESLALADLQLDGVTMGRIASLPRLRALSLTRVQAGSEPVAVLGRLAIESLTLRELDNDSPLAAITSQAPQLQSLALEGAWAGHDAMLTVPKATRLQTVRLIDTRIGNFSLHQLKPLLELRDIVWQGTTFNDYSPLYVRDLPLRSFTCACPGLGDAGLKVLGRQKTLRTLALPQSKITGAGLAQLGKLEQLTSVLVRGRDIGPEGLAALAASPGLSELTLGVSGPLIDPTLAHLGELAGLKRLTLDMPALDDRAAPQLAPLTKLERLALGGTQISDTGLKALAGLTALTELELHHTRVTNRGLMHLGKLARLQALELDHTDLVDDGVAHLAGLGELRALRLDKTLITDAALPHLLGMTKLERLNLADTVVTDEGVALLQRLPALRSVNLANTRTSQAGSGGPASGR